MTGENNKYNHDKIGILKYRNPEVKYVVDSFLEPRNHQ